MNLLSRASSRPTERIVVGVDLAAGRGVTAIAALRLTVGDSEARASLSLLNQGSMANDAAIIAEVARWQPSVVGIDAPLSLPVVVAAAVRGDASPVDSSPFTRAAERDPSWSRLGVRPFPVSFLAGLTFRAIPLAARLREEQPAAQVIEVFPSATLLALGLASPSPHAQRHPRKTSPDRRRATQRMLAHFVAGLAPAADDEQPLGADHLDAILAALTCAAVALGAAQALGDPAEGCIMLPARSAHDLFVANITSHTAYHLK